MRIVHLYKAYFPVPGGIEGHIRMLAEGQIEAGHQVTVLVTEAPRGSRGAHPASLNGVRVIRCPARFAPASTPLSADYFREFARLEADLVHIHSPYPPAEFAALRSKVPYVLSYHAEITRPAQKLIMAIYGPIWRQVLRHARRVIVGSPALASAHWLRGANPSVVPYAVDSDRFCPATPRPRAGVNVLVVGRLRHYKGVDVLLQALRSVPDTRLTILGDGPEAPRLKSLALRLGLADRVQFAGQVSDADLPAFYQQADIFVLPSISRAESFGIVLLEAMASGLPCVTTEVGTGTSFVVQHDHTGLVVPPNDAASLAAALNRLAADENLRHRMGVAGRERVLAEFTRARLLSRMEETYSDACARRN